MAVQEVPRQDGPALDHEHCACVIGLEQSNDRLRAALEKIANLSEVNDDTLTDAVMLASRALASDNHH